MQKREVPERSGQERNVQEREVQQPSGQEGISGSAGGTAATGAAQFPFPRHAPCGRLA
ncbi:hypothetical protein [Streptomyces sp. 8N616]|uniref:hypothetical protein n=1 Tax=Streptomyces sp. 8N616 TaxID=3457414 RepID=UPI003FD36677